MHLLPQTGEASPHAIHSTPGRRAWLAPEEKGPLLVHDWLAFNSSEKEPNTASAIEPSATNRAEASYGYEHRPCTTPCCCRTGEAPLFGCLDLYELLCSGLPPYSVGWGPGISRRLPCIRPGRPSIDLVTIGSCLPPRNIASLEGNSLRIQKL